MSWRVLSSKTLLKKPWLTVREQQVEVGHGVVLDSFHLVESPDWSAVLALTEAREVLLVEQYRHGYGNTSLELPAGVVDAGETPEDAGRRELLEETGYQASELTPLMSVCVEPSRNTNRAHFFFAREVKRVQKPHLDEAEHLVLRALPVQTLLRGLEDSMMVHGVHMAAVLLAARRGLI